MFLEHLFAKLFYSIYHFCHSLVHLFPISSPQNYGLSEKKDFSNWYP